MRNTQRSDAILSAWLNAQEQRHTLTVKEKSEVLSNPFMGAVNRIRKFMTGFQSKLRVERWDHANDIFGF